MARGSEAEASVAVGDAAEVEVEADGPARITDKETAVESFERPM
jgi:hypothetical protein